MSQRLKTLMTIATLALVNPCSFAGATEDLWTALKGGNYPNALAAIGAGADLKSMDPAFGTPLNLAACWADAEVVKALIDGQSELNFVHPANGFTPLINAAYWGNAEAVKLLLAAGADIKVKTKVGQTMLSQAIVGCDLEIIKMLVDAGADPLEKYSIGPLTDQTVMNALISAKEGEERVAYLAGLVEPMSKAGLTLPARMANAQASEFSTLEQIAVYLLEKGADPNQAVAGSWGNILMQSLDFGKTGVARALIEHGANADFDEKKGFNVKDRAGDAAKLPNFTYTNGDFVLAAVLTNNLEFVKLMVEKYPKYVTKIYEGSGKQNCSGLPGGTNYNAEGINLLMVAADKGNLEIVNYLISKGAGRGDAVKIKQSKGDKFCPMFSVMFTMGFARNSNNQGVIDAVKAAGFGKE
ncbi:MAG: ankyrin repeat domain-containing protein [Flavobacteriales bacterium]|nr:ankyrin repeat domain-containing protein [Flavobacteriales bacterium]